jgi:putative ABC transport system permease protein
MILKNLHRRRGRTFLTMFGVAIGVAAIIALGALAEGLESGYLGSLGGTEADLILTDPESYDILLSAIPEETAAEVASMPEVDAASPLLQGVIRTVDTPFLFLFGHPPGSFVLDRFQIVEGRPLFAVDPNNIRGKPILLGRQAAESQDKQVGDSLRLNNSIFRVVGIYETGAPFEDNGAVLGLQDAQQLLGMARQISLLYIRLGDPATAPRLIERVGRLYPSLGLSTSEDLTQRTTLADNLRAVFWAVALLTLVIGAVGMMNTQLMSVLERTREIGVLRAVGWKKWRVLRMVLVESVVVGFLGGCLGVFIAWFSLLLLSSNATTAGTVPRLRPELVIQAFLVVFSLGVLGGLYPAYRASQLRPIEALRYEGGASSDRATQLPVGGLAIKNLWRRKGRTMLTLAAIGITIGGILTLNALLSGLLDQMTDYVSGGEIAIRQRDTASSTVSFIDETVGRRIASLPEVKNVSGSLLVANFMEELGGAFLLQGYSPREEGILSYNIVEGQRITGGRQMMLGRTMSESQGVEVGDTLQLGDSRYRVVGIFESSSGWQELGGIVALRDAQRFAGRPGKVSFLTVSLHDPDQAEAVVSRINELFPTAYASMAGEFSQELPNFRQRNQGSAAVAALAILVGGVTMMNTMLMSVHDRTREIGVLRAMGWTQKQVLALIMRESFAMGLLGGLAGLLVATSLAWTFKQIPVYGSALLFTWEIGLFVQAFVVALLLGLFGGAYPAIRSTRLQPLEALRYE